MLKILTLNWNGKSKLEELYPSLLKNLEGLEWQWVIKDNDSKDGSKELIKSWDNSNIKLIECAHNRDNFSQGVNICFAASEAKDNDLVLLLNNDVIFNDSTSLKKMIALMDNDPDIGVVGARLLYKGTNKLQHAGVVIVNHPIGTPHHFRWKEESDKMAEQNREFQIVTGAVLLTRSSLFKESYKNNKSGLPGLNEELCWAFDDCSYCLNIKYNFNKKVIYCGGTNIFHEESASLKKNPVNKLFMNKNINTFKREWQSIYFSDVDVYQQNKNYNLYKK